jgi:DNA-binding NarL/FixJ family response regulator
MPGRQALLAQIKLRWPNIKVVVLVDTEEERLQLDGTDVDLILLKGGTAARLSDNLKRLLSDNASSSAHQSFPS